MIELNIIPKALKKEIKVKQINHNLKNIYGLILISFVLILVCLSLGKLALQNKFVSTVENTTLLTKSTENYTNQVKSINTKINLIEDIQTEHVRYSFLLNYLSSMYSEDIRFDRISIDKSQDRMEVTGYAEKRDTLLALKEELEGNSIFTEVNFPISNFLQKEKINFQFSAKFAHYEFEQL